MLPFHCTTRRLLNRPNTTSLLLPLISFQGPGRPLTYNQVKAFTRNVSSKANTGDGSMRCIYVHPLSQIVLECLQSNYSDWLVRRQLHNNSLSFHRDGTFTIKFPPTDEESRFELGPQSRIWTSFDDGDKKHWLTVRRGKLLGRYLLQDNLVQAWHGNRKGSLPERIEGAVNEMVEEIEGFERSKNGRF